MKNKIKTFAKQIGVDDTGIAAVVDYRSPRSPSITKLFPEVKSIVVLAFRELSNCESPSPHIAMSGRLDLMDFLRKSTYRMAHFLETECNAKAMTVPATFPMEMSRETKGLVADVSLRHAVVAAGLGIFGEIILFIIPGLKTGLFSLPSSPTLSLSQIHPFRMNFVPDVISAWKAVLPAH